MSEITNNLNTLTITKDEYDNLISSVSEDTYTQQLIDELKDQIEELKKEKQNNQPEIRITHYGIKKDPWYGDSYISKNVDSVEFINLSEVTELANKTAKAKVQSELNDLEKQIENQRKEIKDIKKENTTLKEDQQDKVDEITKNLEKAYKRDTDGYKKTIKNLTEEIQKIKDSKTDAEIEEKRNEEIKTLKLRIKDLERILNELKNTSFFNRLRKLRKIELEQDKAAQELQQREIDANHIGTTWVKENGRVTKFNRFKDKVTQWRWTLAKDWL